MGLATASMHQGFGGAHYQAGCTLPARGCFFASDIIEYVPIEAWRTYS